MASSSSDPDAAAEDAAGPGEMAEEEQLDPRVQLELERLNLCTEEINQLETQLEEANGLFRTLLTDSTAQLKAMAKRLSGGCIEKARPYYEALESAIKAQKECQSAATHYQRASGVHAAAKETIALAEERFLSNCSQWEFDNAWQEMLNHATMKVMDAEKRKTDSEAEHLKRAALYQAAEADVQRLERKLSRHVQKSRPYFEQKDAFNRALEGQKERVQSLQRKVAGRKAEYAQSLRNLEDISESIHAQRRRRRPREPGVGAEGVSASAASAKDHERAMMESLPSFDLDECDDHGSMKSAGDGGSTTTTQDDDDDEVFAQQQQQQQQRLTDFESRGAVVRTKSCPSSMVVLPQDGDDDDEISALGAEIATLHAELLEPGRPHSPRPVNAEMAPARAEAVAAAPGLAPRPANAGVGAEVGASQPPSIAAETCPDMAALHAQPPSFAAETCPDMAAQHAQHPSIAAETCPDMAAQHAQHPSITAETCPDMAAQHAQPPSIAVETCPDMTAPHAQPTSVARPHNQPILPQEATERISIESARAGDKSAAGPNPPPRDMSDMPSAQGTANLTSESRGDRQSPENVASEAAAPAKIIKNSFADIFAGHDQCECESNDDLTVQDLANVTGKIEL